jgi:hypothetical protein
MARLVAAGRAVAYVPKSTRIREPEEKAKKAADSEPKNKPRTRQKKAEKATKL